MKLIDCFMYYDEDLVLDIRFNELNKYVSNFVICEANFNHNGTKRDLKFNINKFSKFKEKIIYLPLREQPANLKLIKDKDTRLEKNSKILDNALMRENFQRNYLINGIKKFAKDDLIIISDLDEIPNLKNFSYQAKITFFEQRMYCYKLNLMQKNFIWYGSRISKKKHLISPQWIRNIKTKKYPIWKLSILFSKKKFNNVHFIKNGGWHFTNIKNAEDIDFKMRNFLHHLEYEESGINLSDIKKIISEKKIIYDHSVDKRGKKWNSAETLFIDNEKNIPSYISKNKVKFKNWLE